MEGTGRPSLAGKKKALPTTGRAKRVTRTHLKLNLCWLEQPNLGDPRVPTNGLWYASAYNTQISKDRQVYSRVTTRW